MISLSSFIARCGTMMQPRKPETHEERRGVLKKMSITTRKHSRGQGIRITRKEIQRGRGRKIHDGFF